MVRVPFREIHASLLYVSLLIIRKAVIRIIDCDYACILAAARRRHLKGISWQLSFHCLKLHDMFEMKRTNQKFLCTFLSWPSTSNHIYNHLLRLSPTSPLSASHPTALPTTCPTATAAPPKKTPFRSFSPSSFAHTPASCNLSFQASFSFLLSSSNFLTAFPPS